MIKKIFFNILSISTSFIVMIVVDGSAFAADASKGNTSTSNNICVTVVATEWCQNNNISVQSSGVADGLNTTSGNTTVGNSNTTSTTTIQSGTGGTSLSSTGSTSISSANNSLGSVTPAISITGTTNNNPVSGSAPAGTGVYITGSGSDGGPDVYISSQNGQSFIKVDDKGVQIVSPTLSTDPGGLSTTSNNFGSGGTNGSGTTLNNNFGAGSSNGGTVNNNIGASLIGGGTVNNSLGGGTGTSTNSVGSVTGGGSSTNNFGTTGTNGNSGTATNNIGTGYGASTNNFGNTNLSTTNSMNAGNTSSFMGNGVSTTSVQPTEDGPGRSILGGYTAANSGTVLRGATGTYASVNANGKIELNANAVAPESSTSMTLTNGYGNVHGIVVNERQTTISGGSYSSSMTLNDRGASFSNSANGRPIQVHGVADGTSNFDAVNLQQLDAVKLGIAGVAAMNNIPALAADKNFNIGVGVGGFDSKQSFALGANARITENLVIKASASHGINANDSNVNTTTWGVGGALSW